MLYRAIVLFVYLQVVVEERERERGVSKHNMISSFYDRSNPPSPPPPLKDESDKKSGEERFGGG